MATPITATNAMLLRTYEVNEIICDQDRLADLKSGELIAKDCSSISNNLNMSSSSLRNFNSNATPKSNVGFASVGRTSLGSSANSATSATLPGVMNTSGVIDHTTASGNFKSRRDSRWLGVGSTPNTSFHLDSVPCPTPISRLRTGKSSVFLIISIIYAMFEKITNSLT